MKKKSIINHIFMALCAMLAFTGCEDQRYLIDGTEIGEGKAVVSAEVTFRNFTPALDGSRAGGTPGDALNGIKNLRVFVYDANTDALLYEKAYNAGDDGFTVKNDNTDRPSDATSEVELPTSTATFKLPLDYGKYRIYAVANISDADAAAKFGDPANYDTPAKLKGIRFEWNNDDISANAQMFGCFTTSALTVTPASGPEDETVIINSSSVNLRAWLRRLASKITVGFNPRGLNEGVIIRIKSVSVHDIAESCPLDDENKPGTSDLLPTGGTITYYTEGNADNYRGWLMLQKGTPNPNKDNPDIFGTDHGASSPSLFFYENNQGDFEGETQYNKEMDRNEMGSATFIPAPNPGDTPGGNSGSTDWKDKVKAGTYIEVVAYYTSINPENPSSGYIKYRFMLGKNITYNYNAERNHHFKLTLGFKGWANNPDWHIDFDEPDPGIHAPNPYFISYTYDQEMHYPLRITGSRLISLRADILDNDINKNSWHAVENDGSNPTAEGVYYTGKIENPGPWNGFLSLRKTKLAAFGSIAEGYGPNASKTYTYNKEYWETNKRGYRLYSDLTNGTHEDSENGDYTVSTEGTGEWIIHIPFYTRAKQMVAQTAYTGNNPYVSYRRQAQVRFTAVIQDKDGNQKTYTEDVVIQQMRRIVNPKGIWRSAGSTEGFHVNLMVQTSEDANSFEKLASIGPWKAVIKNNGGTDWFDLEETPGLSKKTTENGNTVISGESGSLIDFTFRPKSPTTDENPRSGIIKILYNNYTCVHLIFLRQGYGNVQFRGSTTKWHTKNLVYFNSSGDGVETDDPSIEGSYFRQFNTALPISSESNTDEYAVGEDGPKDGLTRDFIIAGTGNKMKWGDIKTNNKSWPATIKVNGKDCKIAGSEDFKYLINTSGDDNSVNDDFVFGFGVLYTDGATQPATTVADAYGARKGNLTGRGMRGVFVCDTLSSEGKNIFFPIGATGYGRFKQVSRTDRYNRLPAGWGGVIQYSNRYTWFPAVGDDVTQYPVGYKPLFWDMFRSPGAIYWAGTNYNKVPGVLDINYHTYDFTVTNTDEVGITWANWAGGPDPSGSDAIQIRLVE